MSIDHVIAIGSENLTIPVTMLDSATGQGKTDLASTGVTVYSTFSQDYVDGLVSVSVSPGVLGDYVSGGWVEVGRGEYQFGVPASLLVGGSTGSNQLGQRFPGILTLVFVADGCLDRRVRVLLVNPNDEAVGAVLPDSQGGISLLMQIMSGAFTALDGLPTLDQIQAGVERAGGMLSAVQTKANLITGTPAKPSDLTALATGEAVSALQTTVNAVQSTVNTGLPANVDTNVTLAQFRKLMLAFAMNLCTVSTNPSNGYKTIQFKNRAGATIGTVVYNPATDDRVSSTLA